MRFMTILLAATLCTLASPKPAPKEKPKTK